MKKFNLFIICFSISTFIYGQGLFGNKTKNKVEVVEKEEVKGEILLKKLKVEHNVGGLLYRYDPKKDKPDIEDYLSTYYTKHIEKNYISGFNSRPVPDDVGSLNEFM